MAKLSKKAAEKLLGVTESSSVLVSRIQAYCRDKGYPEPLCGPDELEFHPARGWRFDFAWPDRMVALEVDGVTPGEGGRHQRVAGYESDCRKYTEAALLGWAVLRCTPRMVERGEVYGFLDRALGADRPHPGGGDL